MYTGDASLYNAAAAMHAKSAQRSGKPRPGDAMRASPSTTAGATSASNHDASSSAAAYVDDGFNDDDLQPARPQSEEDPGGTRSG